MKIGRRIQQLNKKLEVGTVIISYLYINKNLVIIFIEIVFKNIIILTSIKEKFLVPVDKKSYEFFKMSFRAKNYEVLKILKHYYTCLFFSALNSIFVKYQILQSERRI